MTNYNTKQLSEFFGEVDLTSLAEVKAKAMYLPQETLVHLAAQHIVQNAKAFARSTVKKIEDSVTTHQQLKPIPGDRKRKPKNETLLKEASELRQELLYEVEEALAEQGLHHQLLAVAVATEGCEEVPETPRSINSNKHSKKTIKLPQNVQRALQGTTLFENLRKSVADFNQVWEEDQKALQEIEAKAEASLLEGLGILVDTFKETLHIEWTQELLDSEFALVDGTTVKWGEATAEQHESRAKMFEGQAKAGIEGAARHRKALETIKLAEVNTLQEAV